MTTVVDAKSEAQLKQLQRESESVARDEHTAIALGKITTATFALFPSVRKTNSGYILSADFTDLTTGEQLASATSKEYTKSEYLYGSTGAVDELTLALASKLQIPLSDVQKQALADGTAAFTVEAQLALAEQNEAQYKKLMSQFDEQLTALSVSNDLSAVQNKKKLEAERALLVEKQQSEQKRRQELEAQKQRAAADAKLEAERSVELKTKRDSLAKQAAAKAAEVRKLSFEKQSVLGQIGVIESKKKALVDIRADLETRSQQLHVQMKEQQQSDEEKIRTKAYTTVELGSDGQPTQAALTRRENQVKKNWTDHENAFFAECERMQKAVAPQDAALLAEIRADQKALPKARTVSSLGEELKVSFASYEGAKNGWLSYISLYSDGVLLYQTDFIVTYEAVTGKKAPDLEKELNDSVINEYTANVDMYNSLLLRGDPILYFELDYTVQAEPDDLPSAYQFAFGTLRVKNMVTQKTVQTTALNQKITRTMTPTQDVRVVAGIYAQEKEEFGIIAPFLADSTTVAMAKQKGFADAEQKRRKVEIRELMNKQMRKIPGRNFVMNATELTQELYTAVMGKNPVDWEKNRGDDLPVVDVTWFDAIVFCNTLSRLLDLTPAYSVNGQTDPSTWQWESYPESPRVLRIAGVITWNKNANGYRLPTRAEWVYAAKGGQNYRYAGSNTLAEVAWYKENSGDRLHPVAVKKPNGYGLYDMSGNAAEWCWDYKTGENASSVRFVGEKTSDDKRWCLGGTYWNFREDELGFKINDYTDTVCFPYPGYSIRLVQTVK